LKLERWDSDRGEPSEKALRRQLEAEGYSVSRYDYPPGTFFPDHTHAFDKKDAVVRGRFLIRAEGQEFLLGPGDMIEVPAGTRHSAEVIGAQTVISLDASKY
jgi:quercetin dioxygenase-like cupin family protein